ncbi:MAG: class I mannose-6-phosphate isomerase [Planctomycetota bacterium]|nr:class I mannose-6-phosphate isomerase [Planctomycetota bacterium]MDA1213376.1 class I mannose-6-phosphate isomerase [Planctomycetota bacterium]
MNPLVFEPFLRPQVWGGRKLIELHKHLPTAGPYGESWELSGHPLHISRVAEGEFAGRTINELWAEHSSDLVGQAIPSGVRFPLLFKFLEANHLLSVQVHPTDALAHELIGDESGKTEAWVILEALPDAQIFAGLKSGITHDDLTRHLENGTVAECLHSFHPQPGDCIFLSAGSVHAVGGGVLFAEVQQTSDATFRLFDWNRLGTDGRPRQLHKDAALKSIDWTRGPIDPVRGTPESESTPGNRATKLVECDYFTMTSYAVPQQLSSSPSHSFEVWMVLNGACSLRTKDSNYERAFSRGETVLIPASCGDIIWTNASSDQSVSLLRVTPPVEKEQLT